ncbi:MAG: sterol desaturase family protein, partial [Burkholderiales bacterium]|nr:sterol desaturase family protein [Burkholderiales bacterium]
MGYIIVLASPVFLGLICIEWLWGMRLAKRGEAGAQTYRLDDAISSISLGIISQISAIFTRVLRIVIYTLVFEQVALVRDDTWWSTWYGVVLALVLYDFCYYWFHRASHEVALFWAGHAVHHQSQHYNLSTALRQSSAGALTSWVFYLPMALLGVPPLIFGIVALIDLLYQFWVHTEHIGRLGWFDRWFCSPSNHRVHHAVNDPYVDRNYGGIWVVWDRLFGSFQDEDPKEPCVYGTRTALNSWDPLWANMQMYAIMLRDSWYAKRWRDKLMVFVSHPGWRPADVAQRFPAKAFQIHNFPAFQPVQTRAVQWWGGAWFVVLLSCSSAVLWFMDGMVWAEAATCVLAVTAGLWGVNAMLQNRLSPAMCAFVQAAALATAANACGWSEVYLLAKPLALLVLIFAAWQASAGMQGRAWLLAALALSCLG